MEHVRNCHALPPGADTGGGQRGLLTPLLQKFLVYQDSDTLWSSHSNKAVTVLEQTM